MENSNWPQIGLASSLHNSTIATNVESAEGGKKLCKKRRHHMGSETSVAPEGGQGPMKLHYSDG